MYQSGFFGKDKYMEEKEVVLTGVEQFKELFIFILDTVSKYIYSLF